MNGFDSRCAGTGKASPNIWRCAHTKTFSSGCCATEMIIRMVREQGAMTYEQMHHQLNLKVARSLHLDRRGALLPGFWADIIIYDPDALYLDRTRHRVVRDMPGGDWRRLIDAGGYHLTMVNGVVTFEEGVATRRTPGHLIAFNDPGRSRSGGGIAI